MFCALRRIVSGLALGVCFVLPAVAKDSSLGAEANLQARHIATYFPGRMTGSPAEMLAADYLRQQFEQWGYQSNIRNFTTHYRYTTRDEQSDLRSVTGSSVIAVHQGKLPQQIIIMAHLDTFTPQTDSDVNNNLGGLTLQGLDDNASGLGVMLELAQRLSHINTRYTIRFIATSGEEIGHKGAEDLLQRMSETEKKNTLLVINLNSLITGDKLYLNSGTTTPASVVKITRDRGLSLAHRYGINATTNPGNDHYPKGTGCIDDSAVFDKAHIPVLSVSATNWTLGEKNGLQQRQPSHAFPTGTSWHNVVLDNQQYLDKFLPGRVEKRSHDVMRIMLPLVQELAKVNKA